MNYFISGYTIPRITRHQHHFIVLITRFVSQVGYHFGTWTIC